MNQSLLPKYSLILFFIALPFLGFAQVGIGTTDPKTTLDVQGENNGGGVSAKDGVLVPRVSNLNANGSEDGQLVYLTAASGGFQKGFHNWNGSAWVPLTGNTTGTNEGWDLFGNAGTTAGANFVGTRDDEELWFKTNDAPRFAMSTAGNLRAFENGAAAGPIYSWNDTEGRKMGMYKFSYATKDQNLNNISGIALGFSTDKMERIRVYDRGPIEINKTWQQYTDLRNKFLVYGDEEGDGRAIFGYSYGAGGHGVWGENEQGGRGVTGTSKENTGVGVYGSNSGVNSTGTGVYGISYSNGNGVEGSVTGTGYAVYAYGNFGASGTKSFVIDDPRDPSNKILKHFSIESNEVLNLYRGISTFGSDGSVNVTLPDYYSDINKNPSYQLTPLGGAMPSLHIKNEMINGKFIIGGGIPGKKVSWEIKAERNDPYMKRTPGARDVLIDKNERRGKYLMPELYGQPRESGFSYKELERPTVIKSNSGNSINSVKAADH